MNLVVAYDISTDSKAGEKRLRKVAQICQSFGQRVQKSVFECVVDEAGYLELIRRLQDVVHPREDSVRIYRVHDFSRKTVASLGREARIDFDRPLIV
ncbi:MAG: CRISPR-associated endonuclease Cas2 [Alicyclobacillaceae bacterium]|nr:CRISPR-associated endonuclease Cas2 [Alicyclobacillaceae bacterium]